MLFSWECSSKCSSNIRPNSLYSLTLSMFLLLHLMFTLLELSSQRHCAICCDDMTGLSMNILGAGDKSPMQRGFFKNFQAGCIIFLILLLYFLYCNIIIIALFILGLKTSNNLQQFKYKNDKKTLFYRNIKKVKENKPKIQNHFYAVDLLQEPSLLSHV